MPSPSESLHKDPHKVFTIHILIDVPDHLSQRNRLLLRRLNFKIGGFAEVFDKSSVKAVEDREVSFVQLGAKSGSSPQHLNPKDSGHHLTQKHDKFNSRNIDACSQHVYSNDNLRIRPVSEFANPLERSIYTGAAGNLLHKLIPLAEDLPADLHKLIRV